MPERERPAQAPGQASRKNPSGKGAARGGRKKRAGAGGRAGDPSVLGPVLASMPADWEVRPLRDLALSKPRYGSPVPGRPYDADLPRYIRITDMSDDGTLRAISLASITAEEAAPYRLAAGDLLFARSGATVGKTYLYDEGDGACAHAGYVIRFPLDPGRCDPAFVARWTRSTFYHRWVRATLRQAAQANINAGEFGALPVPCPPVAEQRSIAEALDVADRSVAAGARIVAKLELVLEGLLHDLLTRGVSADERLRDPARAPESFADTPLGRLPRHFRVAPLGSLLAGTGTAAMRSGPFGSKLRKSDHAREGIPLLGIDNIGVDRFVPAFRRFVSPSKLAELRRYLVQPGDVMVTIMGTVGRACLVPERIGQALSTKHIWTLTFDRERYAPLLACLQLNHAPWVHAHFRREEQGGTMSAIRSETLRTTLLPVPPLHEQHTMVKILERCRNRLRAERAALKKQKRLRQALIEDLLTGRKRLRD